MPSAGALPAWAWSDVDVAVPRPSRLPGVTMAGFRQRARAFGDIAMVAHPSVSLFIELSDGEGLAYDVAGQSRRGSVVLGLLPGQVRAAGCTTVNCLQIRLEPIVAAAVFGVTTGAVVALEDLWGRDAERAEQRLRAATSWDERFNVAEEILGARLSTRTSVDPEVAHVWRRTFASRGRVRVDGLADEVGWSRKRLWSRFRSQLGITPKRAAQLMRFDHAAHLLAAGHAAGRVASESGYVDQSHLHRDVKAFTGLTPTAVAEAPWLAIDDVAWPGSASRGRLVNGRSHP
ncbi:AraC family transcriptional regulator [Kribbella kalugense]|nr:helix-turn-helix domain-containing protein [Kribbella kalugense]